MIQWENLETQIVRVDFYTASPQSPSSRGKRTQVSRGSRVKLTHGVKKVKGEFVYTLCNKHYKELDNFPGEKVQISENEYHISIIL